jgi:hypothetical protein
MWGFRVNPPENIIITGLWWVLAKEAWHILKPSSNFFYFLFFILKIPKLWVKWSPDLFHLGQNLTTF